jgi:hypothetical protein
MAKLNHDMKITLNFPLRKGFMLSKEVSTIVTTSRNSGREILEYFE